MINTSKLRADTTKLARQMQAAFMALLSNENTWTEKQTFSDFTILGDAAIKVKVLTGTTDPVGGNSVSVPHGVDWTKIVSISCFVNDGAVLIFPTDPDGTLCFTYNANATDLTVTTHIAATSILDKPFTATLIYEE